MSETFKHKRRHFARLSAIQALYQMDIAKSPANFVIDEFEEFRLGSDTNSSRLDADFEYFKDIINGVVKNQTQIDKSISELLSENWSLKRLDMTLRAIMRAAVYELTWRPDVAAPIIIDEYVSLATDFFDQSEPPFVNATLDRYAKTIRKAEYGLAG